MTQKGDGRRHYPQRAAFGLRVREARLAIGLSQEALAERAGVHRTYMSDVERGLRNIGIDNVYALASALEIAPAQLFEDSE